MPPAKQWVAGGELGSSDTTARGLKEIILGIVEDGENVTKALKRLKPVSKRATGKRKTRSTAKQPDGPEEDAEDQAKKERLFSQLTDAANELMNLGFEDIYQDSKAKIADSLGETAEGNANRGGVVWHDDGTVKDDAAQDHAMYQRSDAGDALTFQESAETNHKEHAAPQIPTPVSSSIPQAYQDALAAAQQQEQPSESAATPAQHVTDLFPSEVVEAEAGATTNPVVSEDKSASSPSSGLAQAAAASGQQLQSLTDVQIQQTAALDKPAQELNGQPEEAPSTAQLQPSQQQHGSSTTEGATHGAAAVSGAGQQPANDTQQKPPATDDTVAVSATNTVDGAQQAISPPEAAGIAADTSTPVTTETAVVGAPMSSSTDLAADASQPAGAAGPAPVSTDGNAASGDNSWKGTGRGPGLGQSQEFSGGPVGFTRPKYRHAPYNLPPSRGGGRFGGAAAGPGAGTWSPRGRSSPRGGMMAAPGRGFSEAPRSSTMRPQYSQQAPRPHMPYGGYGQPPPYGYAPQPPPPAYYPPPPQQPYPQQYQQPYPPPQQPYGQPPHAPPPYSGPPQHAAPPPAYAPQYDAPQHDAPWQHQQPQGQYAGYEQPAAYPGAPPAL